MNARLLFLGNYFRLLQSFNVKYNLQAKLLEQVNIFRAETRPLISMQHCSRKKFLAAACKELKVLALHHPFGA